MVAHHQTSGSLRSPYNSTMDVPLEATLGQMALSAAPEIVAAYLFGSTARGTARPSSDVDLAVLLRSRPAGRLSNVAREFEASVERAVRRPVEVVVLNTAPADLVHRVLRDGILVLDRDRPARIRFEVQSRNEYFDLAPLRRLYRRLPA
jgi:predicted nucleotidyltransferase